MVRSPPGRTALTQEYSPQVDATTTIARDAPPPRPSSARARMPPLAWAAAVLVLGLSSTGVVVHREWRDLQERAEEARRELADAGAARLRVPLEQAALMLRASDGLSRSIPSMTPRRV